MLGHRVIRLHTSNDDLEFKMFDKSGENSLIAAIEAGRTVRDDLSPVPTQQDDVLDKIKKLADLRDAGVLTEVEFAEKKQQLLGRL